MKIGLMGFDFSSPNKGCEALTYSFINILKECFSEENLDIVNFSYSGLGAFPDKYPDISFQIRRPNIKNPIDWKRLRKEMAGLDMIFDVTFGDGFSDIYGKMWNITTNMLKQLAIKSSTPLILLPQTYGPYQDKKLRKWAEKIVKNSYKAYSRDTESAEEMNINCDNKIEVLTDMAFALPYNKKRFDIDRTKTNIGINVSSLLWDTKYAAENKFGLRTDYQTYITSLIEKLIKEDEYVIHLIPHVINTKDFDDPENDVRACMAVKQKFAQESIVVCSPSFKGPIEAKSYIANMDFFTGARMHATIGAISAGVATMPFAYSKKFETMFRNLGYNHVLDAKKLSTEEAIGKTLGKIKKRDNLSIEAKVASEKAKKKIGMLKEEIKKK